MLPKERVIAALEQREPDRVPIGETWVDAEVIEQAIGRQTLVGSEWPEWMAEWEGKRDEVVASYKRDLVDLVRAFEWDFVVVPLMPARRAEYRKPEMLDAYTWRDGSGRVWRYSPETGGLPMLISAPAMDATNVAAAPSHRFDESRLELIEHMVKELGGTHFIFGNAPDGTFPWEETVGLEEFLIRMATDPEFVTQAVAVHLEAALQWVEAMCDLGVDGIFMARDYCDNNGPIMGPRYFRRFVLPAFRQVVQATRRKGKFFLKHTDGKTWSVLEDFLAAGVQGWQGIQPPIGMDLRALKEKFAGRLCLFGGVNCDTLIRGTPAEVIDEVKYALRYAAPGGGYVATSGNTLYKGTRAENYQAMRATIRELGKYPIRIG